MAKKKSVSSRPEKRFGASALFTQPLMTGNGARYSGFETSPTDVLAWFRAGGKTYQTYLNDVLRREMQARPRGRQVMLG
jgi:hypothetical protein